MNKWLKAWVVAALAVAAANAFNALQMGVSSGGAAAVGLALYLAFKAGVEVGAR